MEAGLYPRPEEAGAGSTGGGNRVLRCCCLGGAIRGPAVKRATESHPGGGCPAQIPLEAVATGLGWWGWFFFLRSRLVLASVVSRGAGWLPARLPTSPPSDPPPPPASFRSLVSVYTAALSDSPSENCPPCCEAWEEGRRAAVWPSARAGWQRLPPAGGFAVPALATSAAALLTALGKAPNLEV